MYIDNLYLIRKNVDIFLYYDILIIRKVGEIMEYVSLYKMFFKEPKNFEEIYANRLHCLSSVQLDFTFDMYPAFYIATNEMIKLINDIQQYNAKIIEMITVQMPSIALPGFISEMLVEEIKTTNDIEGVVSTRQEIKKIVTSAMNCQGKRLYGLVNKYTTLLEHQEKNIYTCSEIRELYNEVLLLDIEREDVNNIPDGTYFRKEGVAIYKDGRVVHQGIYPEEKIIEQMNQALYILNNKEIPLLIRVAIFHYLFGYIHPFYDGNGRLNRLLSSCYLKQEMHLLCALQVSTSCKERQSDYINAFTLCNDIRNRGDLTPFILSFLEIYKSGLEQLVTKVSKKVLQYEYYVSMLNEQVSYPYEIIEMLGYFIQSTLFTSEGLSIHEIMRITKSSEPTARKRINQVLQSDFKEAIVYMKNKKPIRYQVELSILDTLLDTMIMEHKEM